MSHDRISRPLVRDAPVVREDATVEQAVRAILDSGLPAVPVVDDKGNVAGVFGEREFLAALFPGYVGELRFAGFVTRSLDDALDKRASCRHEPVSKHMTTEHVDVSEDASDLQVAETFLHHRVRILPVRGAGGLKGVITRGDFFTQLAERFLEKWSSTARPRESLKSTMPRAAAAIWARIDRRLVDRAAWVPMINELGLDFVSARLRNYQFHPYWGLIADQVWLAGSSR